MPKYTYAQIEQLWITAGGNPQAAPTAAAVAMAESGGNSDAIGHNQNGSQDRGLWQINSVHGSQSTTDLMGNARAAIAISQNGSNWRPWCTAWTDGCKGTYAPTAPNTPSGRAFAAGGGGDAEVLVPNAAPATEVSSNPLTADFWTHVIDVVGNWIVYTSLIIAGGVAALIGIALLARNTTAARQITSRVTALLPFAV